MQNAGKFRTSLERWTTSIVSLCFAFSLAACNDFKISKPASVTARKSASASNNPVGGGSSGGLSYSGGFYSLTKNTAITSIVPTMTPGSGSSFSISPALPAGLNFNASTGVISGTPTTVRSLTNHTITATGGGKTLSAQINIEVLGTGPTNSVVSATTSSTLANGSSKLNISVRLMTANNNPVPNNRVVLYSSRNAIDTIEAVNSKSDAAGYAYFTVRSSVAGSANLFAADLDDQVSIVPTATVQFVPGPATQLIYTQAPTSTTAGTAFSVEVTVRDANNNIATGFSGTASAVSSDPHAAVPEAPVSFTNGVAQLTGIVLKSMGSQTINVVSGSLSAGSRSILVSPGPASRLSIQTQPSTTATAGSDLSIQPVVSVTDAFGNLVSGSSAPITLEGFSDAGCTQPAVGSLTASVNPVSAVSGVSSFNGVKLLKTDVIRIGASAGGLQPACSNAIAVAAAVPFAANSGITGSGPVIANGIQASTITVSLQDSYGNPVPGVVPTFNATDTGGSNQYGTCSATDSSGSSTCSLKSNKAEIKALSLLTPVAKTGGSVTFTSSTLASFTVSGFPGSVVAGSPNAITITALDSSQNTVTGYTGTIHIASDDPQAALGPNITFDPADQGQKTVYNLILKSAGTWKIEVSDAASPSLKGSQTAITVSPAAYSDSNSLLTAASESVTSGSSVLVTLTARDAYGNTNPTGVPGAGSISFTSTSNAGTGSFDSVTTAGSGVFTSNFTGTLSGLVTLGAQISGVTQTASSAITVNPGAATTLVLGSVPATINAGSSLNLLVSAKDAAGNTATGFSGTVSIASTDGNATLPTPAPLANGVGTFATTLNTAGTATITASSGALSVTSSNITVNPLFASELELTSVPTTATAGGSFTITVRAKDSLGNTAISYGGTVSILSTDGNAALPTPAMLTNGVGSFTVTLKTAASQTLTARDGTLSKQSGAILVGSAAASSLVLGTIPSSATAGLALDFSVTAKDTFGNTVTGYSQTVTINSTDDSAELPAPSSLPSGTKTFTGFQFRTAGTRTLTASDGTLSVSSSPITVNPAPIASLVLGSIPAQDTAGEGVTFSVTAKDAFGNTANSSVPVIITSSDSEATLPPAAQLVNGTKSFLVIHNIVGNKTITASDGMRSVTSSTISVIPGPLSAANSVVTASASTVASGSSITATLTTKDAYGNLNPSGLPALGQITFTSTASPGSGTLGPVASSGSGVYTATFTGVKSGSVTLGATISGVAVGNSTGVTVQGGAATSLALSGVPASITAGVPFNVTVSALDVQNNVATGFADTIQFDSTDTNAALPASAPLTNGTGVFSITLRTAGTRTVTFTPVGTSGVPAKVSNSITVNPAPASQLLVSGLSSTATAGTILSFTVTAKDSFGNVDTNFADSLTAVSSDGNAIPPPTAGLSLGVGSFNITLKTAGIQTFSLSNGGALSTSNQNVTVSASIMAADNSVMTTSNSSVESGSSVTATLTTKDAYGNSNPSNAAAGLISFWGRALNITGVSEGKFHTCVIVNGSLQCLGQNSNGQIGNGASGNTISTPYTVFSSGVTSVSAGNTHTCAVVSGSLRCFGDNTKGQIGNGSTGGNVTSPHTVFESDVTAVAVGNEHTCAVVSGSLRCFGGSSYLQVGTTGSAVTNPYTVIASGVTAVAAGGNHTCAIVNGALQCFGRNNFYQLGNTDSDSATPYTVFSSGVTAVAAGDTHTCAIASGALRCFGSNNAGQIGTGAVTSSISTPYEVYSSNVQTVAAGFAHTCALVAGSMVCFGHNNYGQIGNGGNSNTPSPYTVTSSDVTMVAAGGFNSCAIISGDLKCIGHTEYGQLGANVPIPSATTPTSLTLTGGTIPTGSFGSVNNQGSGVFSASFTGSTVGQVTLGANISGAPISSTTQVVVSPGTATQLTVVNTPTTLIAGDSFSFRVTARDAANNIATGFSGTVSFTSTDDQATLPGSSTFPGGSKTFSATLKTSGSHTITATRTTLNGTSSSITVNAAAYDLTQSTVTASNSSVTSGSSITVTLTAKDAYGNTNPTGLPASTSAFSFTSSSNQGTGTFGSVTGLGAGVYQASLTGGLAGPVTLGATISATPVDSSYTVTVNPAPPSSFQFVSIPSSVTAGSSFAFSANALDLNGNLCSTFNGAVSLTSTDTQASLSSPVTFSGGTGSFTATLKSAPSQSLTLTSGSITSSSTVTVNPASATQLAFGSVPSSSIAGSSFNIGVTALDAFGNTVTGYAGTISFSSNDGAASLPSASTLSGGSQVFPVTLKTAGNRTITVVDGTLSKTSTAIAVTPGAYSAPQSTITLSASSIRTGLSVTAYLNAKDAFGNPNPTGLPAAVAISFSTSGTGTFGSISGPVAGVYQALYTGVSTANVIHTIGGSISGNAVGAPAALSMVAPLAIIPGNFNYPLGRPLTLSLGASGGAPGYTFSKVSGPGTLSGSTLTLGSGTRVVGDQTVIRVTDAQNDSATCTINHVPMIGSGDTLASVTLGNDTFIGGTFRTLSPHYARGFMPVDPASGEVLDLGMASGFNGTVRAIVTSGRYAYVGGNFSTYRGIPAKNLAKIDLVTGGLEPAFASLALTDGTVNALAVDGRNLHVGGEFTSCGNLQNLNALCVLDIQSGSLSTHPLNASGILPSGSTVNTLAASGSSLFIGGTFGAFRGDSTIQGLAKINLADGLADTTFHSTQNLDPNTGGTTVNALLLVGSDLYAGGDFSSYRNDPKVVQIAKLDATSGVPDPNFHSYQPNEISGAVYAIAYDHGWIYIGGDFESYRDDPNVYKLARLSEDSGTQDGTGFNSQPRMDVVGSVRALQVVGGDLFVGGEFPAYQNDPRGNRLIKVAKDNGTLDTTFNGIVDGGPDLMVRTILHEGGRLLVGGDFNSYRGIPAPFLAKINNTTGLIDSNFTQAAGPNAPVRALALHPSLGLYVGGDFTQYRNSARGLYLMKLEPSSGDIDPNFNIAPGSGPNFRVQALAIDPNASNPPLYVGGMFTSYRGDTRGFRLMKLNSSNGDLDTASFNRFQLTGPNASVTALALDPTGGLFAGGDFTSYRGLNHGYRLIKVSETDGTLDSTFNSSSSTGPNGPVYAIKVDTLSSTLFVGGSFSNYRGTSGINNILGVNLTTGTIKSNFTLGGGTAGPVYALVPDNGGFLYIGGDFTQYRGLDHSYLIRVDTGFGNIDSGFHSQSAPGPNADYTGIGGTVYSLSQNPGDPSAPVIVGGSFKNYLDQFSMAGVCAIDQGGNPRW